MDNRMPIPWIAVEIMDALGLESAGYGSIAEGLRFDSVSTDSRTIRPGQLFVALAGECFDGHAYIPDMIKKGVLGFVVNRARMDSLRAHLSGPGQAPVLFPVDSTLKAMGDLARYQRLRSGVKVVAITGSNGKTSTREMTAAIFSTRFNTLSTRGNYNNEIGLPHTLLGLSRDHEWAVVEMGMNHAGEIARLGSIALPDIGIITNTAECHLEGLGTVTNVAMAKAELLGAITQGGAAVLNLDDPRHTILASEARKNKDISRVIWFGMSPGAGIRAENVRALEGRIVFTLVAEPVGSINVVLNSPAPFMVINALAASSAALHAGIGLEDVKAGLEAFNPVSGRMALMNLPNGIHLINDTYNANPASMAAALETLAILSRGGSRVAVLGDMLELGPGSRDLHRQMGVKVKETGVSRLYVFGDMGRQVLEGAIEAGFDQQRVMSGTKAEIIRCLIRDVRPGSWILVKGSRGMRMEEIVAALQQVMEQQ
ncbi:MAG: UDP-N-acetylmuramoyl-tripeptide--D-alanyl-D-alanine ligase [Pseudomonadota bacterium]